MQDTLYIVLSVCAVAVTAVAVWIALMLRETSRKIEENLGMLLRELPPTLALLRQVAEEAEEATAHFSRAGERREKTTVAAADMADSTLGFLASQGNRLARFAMVASGLINGVKTAVDVYGKKHSGDKPKQKEAENE
jgi:hypothetical protein